MAKTRVKPRWQVGKVFKKYYGNFDASGNRVKLTNLRPIFHFLAVYFTYAV